MIGSKRKTQRITGKLSDAYYNKRALMKKLRLPAPGKAPVDIIEQDPGEESNNLKKLKEYQEMNIESKLLCEQTFDERPRDLDFKTALEQFPILSRNDAATLVIIFLLTINFYIWCY